MSLCKAIGEMALLWSDSLLGGPVVWRCDNKAALSLCKDGREGERVEHTDVIHHFAHVASGELPFPYCKSEENVSDCLTRATYRSLLEKGSEFDCSSSKIERGVLEIMHTEGTRMRQLV
jgi:hypothetical protein